jgi:hypothetical protein
MIFDVDVDTVLRNGMPVSIVVPWMAVTKLVLVQDDCGLLWLTDGSMLVVHNLAEVTHQLCLGLHRES